MVRAAVAALVAGLLVIPVWFILGDSGLPLWLAGAISIGICAWPAWASGNVAAKWVDHIDRDKGQKGTKK